VIQADNAPHVVAGPPVAFKATSQTGIRHRDGTVSLARDPALDTATTNFFICIGDQPSLDDGGTRSADRLGFAAPHAGQQLTPVSRITRSGIRA
jgi:cyclophilin family peptidyl-prolyl cis-trans isomerase